MKVALIVLALLCFIPYALAWISAYFRQQQLGKIDNKNPRQQYAQLTGVGARAVAAQQNSWEFLPVYAAALLAVSAASVEVDYLTEAASGVLIFRLLHAVFYLTNIDLLRSPSFVLALLPCLYLFYSAIFN